MMDMTEGACQEPIGADPGGLDPLGACWTALSTVSCTHEKYPSEIADICFKAVDVATYLDS